MEGRMDILSLIAVGETTEDAVAGVIVVCTSTLFVGFAGWSPPEMLAAEGMLASTKAVPNLNDGRSVGTLLSLRVGASDLGVVVVAIVAKAVGGPVSIPGDGTSEAKVESAFEGVPVGAALGASEGGGGGSVVGGMLGASDSAEVGIELGDVDGCSVGDREAWSEVYSAAGIGVFDGVKVGASDG
jgi:hypothetical protein